MEYQKIANLLDNRASNQPSKFRTKKSVESRGGYTTGSYIRFKTKMLSLVYGIMLMNTYFLREQ